MGAPASGDDVLRGRALALLALASVEARGGIPNFRSAKFYALKNFVSGAIAPSSPQPLGERVYSYLHS